MAGKIYTILLIFGIIFDFIILIFFDLEKAIYGTYFFGILAIAIAVNLEINLLKIKKFPKTLNEREKEIIAEN